MSANESDGFSQREMIAAVITFLALFPLGWIVLAFVPLPRTFQLFVAALDVSAALGVPYWMATPQAEPAPEKVAS